MAEANLKTKNSDAILKANRKQAIARHGEGRKETIALVNKLRITVEAEKICKETSAKVIEEWSKIVENAMEKADRMVEILEQWLEEQDAKKKKIQLEQKAERENRTGKTTTI
jgi:predicted membrane chloride channel (bestrophin family)